MSITLNSFTPNTKIESAKVSSNFQALSDHLRPSLMFTVDEILLVGTSKTPTVIVPISLTIEAIYAVVNTAPTGASILIDINKNGTSIWNSNPNNRITIAAGQTQPADYPILSFDTSSLSAGDKLTLDIDQVGSTVAGETLTVLIVCS